MIYIYEMRTTIDIPDALFRRVKREAAERGISMREIIIRGLQAELKGRTQPKERYRLHWRTETGRILPGVRLDDRDALFDLMDDRR